MGISSGSAMTLERRLANDDPDVRLMLRVRDDEPGAFERLLLRYQNRVLGIMTHLVGDADAAEDLTQDVFLRVFRSRKRYKPTAKFATWLFTIANNLARNHLRTRGRRAAVPLHQPPGASSSVLQTADLLPGRETTASTQMRQVELSEVVREALDGLGDDQKLAVLLNKFEGLGYADIAAVMGRSEAAVKSLLARARFNLRDRLEAYLTSGQKATALPAHTNPDKAAEPGQER